MIKKFAYILCSLIWVSFFSLAQDPMSDVISMLDSDGGLRTGTNKSDGYYVVSLAFSERTKEISAKEEAKLDAMKGLSEFLNGTSVSGSSSALTEFISEKQGDSEVEYSTEHFIDVVNTQFKGSLSAIKALKQGKYNGRFFVALAITEADTNQKNVLISTSQERSAFAGEGSRVKVINAKGFSSLSKRSKSEARKAATQDALRNAVQQAKGVAISSKSGRFGEALTMAISSQSKGYVRSYEIINEHSKRGEYLVEVVAEVDEGKLVKDARLYFDAFNSPTFALENNDDKLEVWFKRSLEKLGFSLQSNTGTASHLFKAHVSQNYVENHKGAIGFETEISISLEDRVTSEILFTVANNVTKSRIYVSPESRAKQVSKRAALKSINKQLAPEIISALAKAAERGTTYHLILNNANRLDLRLFKQVFNNGTTGVVKDWQWSKAQKTLTLSFQYVGPLSEAMDQGLEQLYQAYKLEGKNRRPKSDAIGKRKAVFTIVKRG